MMLVFLEILCVLLLTACAVGASKENRCKLNNNLEYLHTESLSKLNLPEDLHITKLLSVESPKDDYVIPDITQVDAQEVGNKINICPPLVCSMDVLHKSCLINIED